jgi:hypothetical protein
LTIGAIVTIGFAALFPPVQAQPQSEPYSCRLLDDEECKCAFDPHCDRLVIERLVKECRRKAGGHRDDWRSAERRSAGARAHQSVRSAIAWVAHTA